MKTTCPECNQAIAPQYPPDYLMGDCMARCLNCIREFRDGHLCECGNPQWSMYYLGIQELRNKIKKEIEEEVDAAFEGLGSD